MFSLLAVAGSSLSLSLVALSVMGGEGWAKGFEEDCGEYEDCDGFSNAVVLRVVFFVAAVWVRACFRRR